MTKTFVILRTDYPMEIHAAGCRDLSSRKNRSISQDWQASGETIEEVVADLTADLNSDFDREYKQEELFRIMPCCKEVK